MGQLSFKFEICNNFHKPTSKKPPKPICSLWGWQSRRKSIKWVTSHLQTIPLAEMETEHIQRVLARIDRRTSAHTWAKRNKAQWTLVFKKELYYREQNAITKI